MTTNQLPNIQSDWYAVYTRSRAEKKLYALLLRKGVECFLPLKKTLVQRSDRKKWVELPLLPSYLFVKVSKKDHFMVLNTPGAVKYVSFEGHAVAIAEEQIRYLRHFIQNKHHDLEVITGSFAEGDFVEVTSGPMKGVKGEVVQIRGKQRLLLRFNALGYCVHVETSLAELKTNVGIAV